MGRGAYKGGGVFVRGAYKGGGVWWGEAPTREGEFWWHRERYARRSENRLHSAIMEPVSRVQIINVTAYIFR